MDREETEAAVVKPTEVDNEPSFADRLQQAMDDAEKQADEPVKEEPKAEKSVEDAPVKEPEAGKADDKPKEDDLPVNPNLLSDEEKEEKELSDEFPDGAYENEEAQIKARQAFKKVRNENKTLRSSIREAEEKLTKLELTGSNNTDAEKKLEALQEELETYKQRSAIADFRQTDEYKSRVIEPVTDAEATLKSIADRYDGVNANQLIAAVKSGDVDLIIRATEDLSAYEQGEIATARAVIAKATKMESIMEGKAAEFAKDYQSKNEQQTQASIQQQLKQFQRGVDQSWKNIQEQNPILRDIEGNDSWNKSLSSIRDEITSMNPADLSPDQLADYVAGSKVLPHYRSAYNFRTQENATLKAELAEAKKTLSELKAVSPGTTTSSKESAASDEDKYLEMTPAESIMARLKAQGHK
jgi:transposase-like protein